MQSVVERVAADVRENLPSMRHFLRGRFRRTSRRRSSSPPGPAQPCPQRRRIRSRHSRAPRSVVVSGTMEELASRKWQRICVSDNGPGIPAHDLPKIFLPFYTTKSEGTGLGLAVVQKVALQHGGSIEAKNLAPTATGGGAEFMPLLTQFTHPHWRRIHAYVTFAAGSPRHPPIPRQSASKLGRGDTRAAESDLCAYDIACIRLIFQHLAITLPASPVTQQTRSTEHSAAKADATPASRPPLRNSAAAGKRTLPTAPAHDGNPPPRRPVRRRRSNQLQ